MSFLDVTVQLLDGFRVTLLMFFVTLACAIPLGLVITFGSMSRFTPLRYLTRLFVWVIRGTPLMVQLMFIFYGLPMIGVKIPDISWIPNFSRFAAGVVAMSMNSCAYVAEVIRSGIQAVDYGQTEAARSVGFSSGEAMRLVVLPQAIKNILPALGNEFVTVIKESSIVSVIGIADLMFRTNDVIALSYKSLECLAVAALIYFVLTFISSRLVSLAERKLSHGK